LKLGNLTFLGGALGFIVDDFVFGIDQLLTQGIQLLSQDYHQGVGFHVQTLDIRSKLVWYLLA
jgi:hypothetical protein